MGKHVTDNGAVHNVHMPQRIRPLPKKQRRRAFLREWRTKANRTLEQAAEAAGMTHASLSRIERGLQDYNQSLLEFLADYYGAPDVASLLMRDPTDPEAIWSIWDQAKQGQRKTIVEVAKTIVKTGT
jgi:transcriptional regulator with XRE-family HTH domain